jgi:hypothetical protein
MKTEQKMCDFRVQFSEVFRDESGHTADVTIEIATCHLGEGHEDCHLIEDPQRPNRLVYVPRQVDDT